MKKQLLLPLLFLGQIALGQTNELIKVAGTKCSLIPPAGFVAATKFSGFQDTTIGASIMINELPAPYLSTVESLTADAFKAKGMTLVSKQSIHFNGSKAILISVTQPAYATTYIKQMLIFGDGKVTISVNGIYPEESKTVEAKIKNTLLSTVYDSTQNDDPLSAATFSIDVTDTDFKLIKYMSGSLIYSTDGKLPTDKATLIVGNSIGKVAVNNQKEYAEKRLKKLPGGERLILRIIKEITIDNLKGYEIIAGGKTKEDKTEIIYQVMLFDGKGDYYIIVGTTREDTAQNIKTFKSIARTFKRK